MDRKYSLFSNGRTMKKKSTIDITRKRYNRLAFWYDFLEAPMEWMGFAAWRPRVLNRIRGNRILEVGFLICDFAVFRAFLPKNPIEQSIIF